MQFIHSCETTGTHFAACICLCSFTAVYSNYRDCLVFGWGCVLVCSHWNLCWRGKVRLNCTSFDIWPRSEQVVLQIHLPRNKVLHNTRMLYTYRWTFRVYCYVTITVVLLRILFWHYFLGVESKIDSIEDDLLLWVCVSAWECTRRERSCIIAPAEPQIYHKDKLRMVISGRSVPDFHLQHNRGTCAEFFVSVRFCAFEWAENTHTHSHRGHTQASFFSWLSKASWAVSPRTGSPSVWAVCVRHTHAHRPTHWYIYPTGAARCTQVSINMQGRVEGLVGSFFALSALGQETTGP